MYSTTFSSSSIGFVLVVDSSKSVATTAWLELRGCRFDRYISPESTRYVFTSISDSTAETIAAKYPVEIESIEDMSLEQLFATADVIGNKYQDEEVERVAGGILPPAISRKFVTSSVMSEFNEVCRRFNFDDGALSESDSQFLTTNNLDISDDLRGLLVVV